MTITEPGQIPSDRQHLDAETRRLLLHLDLAVAQGRHEVAQELAEDLWATATDAHRTLFQAVSNALTAVCARERGQDRGARQIVARTQEMLAPYPPQAAGLELPTLVDSVERFIERGSGPILLRRQG